MEQRILTGIGIRNFKNAGIGIKTCPESSHHWFGWRFSESMGTLWAAILHRYPVFHTYPMNRIFLETLRSTSEISEKFSWIYRISRNSRHPRSPRSRRYWRSQRSRRSRIVCGILGVSRKCTSLVLFWPLVRCFNSFK